MIEMPDEDVDSFEFDSCGEGYGVRFVDYGGGGIMLTITRPSEQAPYWDREAAVMLSNEQFDLFLDWASRTCNRPGLCLPEETLACLKRELHKMSRRSRGVIFEAIHNLEKLNQDLSLARRAFNR